MLKYVVELDRLRDTHSEYVILIDLLWQQCLCKHTLVLQLYIWPALLAFAVHHFYQKNLSI